MKKFGSFIVLSSLLIVSFFCVFLNVPLVSAAEMIYIRADGSIEGTAKIVTNDNVIYTFIDNINGSIIIERDNIVIDGSNYLLRGEGASTGTGISLNGTHGATNVTVRNTQVTNFEVGIWISDRSNNNSVYGNILTDNRYAIEVDVSSYNNISENMLSDNGNGIWLGTQWGYDDEGSSYNNVIGNTITSCSWDAIGMTSYSCNNTISRNSITQNQYGITIDGNCDNTTIRENNIEDSLWGISLDYKCNYTVICRNSIRNAVYGYGIFLARLSDTSVYENNVTLCLYGIYFWNAADNMFWHNNFVNNTQQVYFSGDSYVNVWDDGYPSGGNYWNDYTGVDANSDGIGDTPYIIDGNNQDRYPLMSPYGQVLADLSPPTTVHNYNGLWHTSDFTITLTATDDLSGVAEIYYKINNSPIKTVSADGHPIITTEGSDNTLEYWSQDNTGKNESIKTLTGIKLDKTAPTGSITINDGDNSTTSTSITLSLTYSDATSGIYQVRYSNDGSSWSSWESPSATKAWNLTSDDGSKIVYFQIRDNAGLLSSIYNASITLQSPSTPPDLTYLIVVIAGVALAAVGVAFFMLKKRK